MISCALKLYEQTVLHQNVCVWGPRVTGCFSKLVNVD